MNWTTTLPFILDGVDGDLRITYNPLSQKFYHNGLEIKRKGFSFGGAKYKIATTDGGDDIVKVKGNLKLGRQIEFRGETINLEKPLNGVQLLLSLLPVIAIIAISLGSLQAGFGIAGGAILGFSLALGMLTAATLIRNEEGLPKQILFSIACSIGAVVVMFLLSFIIGLIFGGALLIGFSLF